MAKGPLSASSELQRSNAPAQVKCNQSIECAEIDGMDSVNVADASKLSIQWTDGLRSEFDINDIMEHTELERPIVLSDYVTAWKQLGINELPRMDIDLIVQLLYVVVNAVHLVCLQRHPKISLVMGN
ncbi:hypothetical protein KIN20_019203 [Parelaphostrongylus tenuis]|uniref:Uncharacterized protein n=1 Tax=Parelaphostrongylus tenuis TaxID=148309 RepID=A0AAD5N1Z3_PARTN|nr:hypothetical protein KIN20_019203 [Parelaphostrongylus tenuis]